MRGLHIDGKARDAGKRLPEAPLFPSPGEGGEEVDTQARLSPSKVSFTGKEL